MFMQIRWNSFFGGSDLSTAPLTTADRGADTLPAFLLHRTRFTGPDAVIGGSDRSDSFGKKVLALVKGPSGGNATTQGKG